MQRNQITYKGPNPQKEYTNNPAAKLRGQSTNNFSQRPGSKKASVLQMQNTKSNFEMNKKSTTQEWGNNMNINSAASVIGINGALPQNLPTISNSGLAQNNISPAIYSNKASDIVSNIIGGQKQQISMYDSAKNSSNDELLRLRQELQLAQKQLVAFKTSDDEKSKKIEQQRAEITKLRKENIEYNSQINRLKNNLDEEKKKVKDLREQNRNTQGGRGTSTGNSQADKDLEEIRALQLAMQFEDQERRHRDRDMMLTMMLGGHPMYGGNSQQLLEQQQLQRVIEESKQDNPDNMTYEQMLELGERIGKVSKGLTQQQISKIPWKFWRASLTKKTDCSICFEEFADNQKFKVLPDCLHEYHHDCINKWLNEEKRCPVCNKDVIISP
eukprot:403341818